ncbi:hypothetical protein [Streptomyces sp. NPDC051561]|uniref:hypothetical protein n=1 Tax=Streptomyces sp. NPDC051561 TaxID=3365658 RepID=UPI00378DF1FA
MSRLRQVLRPLAVLGATAALTLGVVSSAHADTINVSVVPVGGKAEFHGCYAKLQLGIRTSDQRQFARGQFVGMGLSTRNQDCVGWLQRSNGNGWVKVSGDHYAADYTAWYYDDHAYKSRVCVGDFLYSNSYTCGQAF